MVARYLIFLAMVGLFGCETVGSVTGDVTGDANYASQSSPLQCEAPAVDGQCTDRCYEMRGGFIPRDATCIPMGPEVVFGCLGSQRGAQTIFGCLETDDGFYMTGNTFDVRRFPWVWECSTESRARLSNLEVCE